MFLRDMMDDLHVHYYQPKSRLSKVKFNKSLKKAMREELISVLKHIPGEHGYIQAISFGGEYRISPEIPFFQFDEPEEIIVTKVYRRKRSLGNI